MIKKAFILLKRHYIYVGIFLILFIFNLLTPYASDDFTYRLSFATGEPLQNFWQIFPSMAVHAQTMNGRISAHFLVQLFMLVPPIVFDAVNALLFCTQIALILSFSSNAKHHSLLAATVFCAIFLFEPMFGQINLWQDGAVNYLWSVVIILIYLQPFSSCFLSGKTQFNSILSRIGFFIFSFFMGSYSETASSAAIFMSALLFLADVLHNHRKLSIFKLSCILSAFVGYISIYLAPAQWNNKSTELSLRTLLYNFKEATSIYFSFGILVYAALVLLILNYYKKTSTKTIIMGLVFIAGSLAANYIMVLAAYYHERSSVSAFILLLIADVILLVPLLDNLQWKPFVVSASSVLILSCLPVMLSAGLDVAYGYLHVMENRRQIAAAKESGIYEVVLPVISPATEHSAFYDLKYLDTTDCNSWPNAAMAKYYEVESILGAE